MKMRYSVNYIDDENFYFPSTQSHFQYRMDYLLDSIKSYCNIELESYIKRQNVSINNTIQKYFSKLIPNKFDAAKFYILPKVHKEYHKFPKGRPISSTCQTATKGLSQLLDKFLQPLMCYIPDLILDTSHFLMLLNNLRLNPRGNYALLTVDIESLYTNLNVRKAKEHCCDMFNIYKRLIEYPVQIENNALMRLMDWCLDNHFIKYKDKYYFQHKGIAMGGAASVSIANISVFYELKSLLKGPEVVFKVRFIDDLFLILDMNLITDLKEWITNQTNHNYLRFTYSFDSQSINFLDVRVSLNAENKIVTSLYKKPMNKHQYLHYDSNHPICNLKSIPFSQGIRILRICSEPETQVQEINSMIEKFHYRNYPVKLLNECIIKLQNLSREVLLRPKTKLVINILKINNPEILQMFDVSINNVTTINLTSKAFIVMPFYKSIYSFSRIIKNTIRSNIIKCQAEEVKSLALEIMCIVSYCKINNVQRLIECN